MKSGLTEHEMHRFINPPPQKHEERHPEERELDTQVDRACLGELLGDHGFPTSKVVEDALSEERDGDAAVG